MFAKIWRVIPLLFALCVVNACGGGAAPGSVQTTAAPQANPPATEIPTAVNSPSANTANVPSACSLLTTADVEKITGYGNGAADSQALGSSGLLEDANSCTIIAEGGKFQVQALAGRDEFLPLPNQAVVDLEAGAKGIVKDSGIGQKWMDRVQFPNYSVRLNFWAKFPCFQNRNCANFAQQRRVSKKIRTCGLKTTSLNGKWYRIAQRYL